MNALMPKLLVFAKKRCPTGVLISEGALQKLYEPRPFLSGFEINWPQKQWNLLPNFAICLFEWKVPNWFRKACKGLGEADFAKGSTWNKDARMKALFFLKRRVPKLEVWFRKCPKNTFWTKASNWIFFLWLWEVLSPKTMSFKTKMQSRSSSLPTLGKKFAQHRGNQF